MKKPRILVVYFTNSGNTQNVGRQIAKALSCDIKRIRPKFEYPDSRPELLKVSKEEITANYHPPLLPLERDLKKYDTIIIGSPNWYHTVAPPVATFLSENDFTGKKIAPFITHGGGERGECIEDISGLINGGELLEELCIHRDKINLSSSKIKKWLDKIGIE